jgi:hypothetical protein
VDGDLYSALDGTRRRPGEMQVTAAEVHVLEDSRLVAAPVLEVRPALYRRGASQPAPTSQQHHASKWSRGATRAARRRDRRGAPVAGHL